MIGGGEFRAYRGDRDHQQRRTGEDVHNGTQGGLMGRHVQQTTQENSHAECAPPRKTQTRVAMPVTAGRFPDNVAATVVPPGT